MAFPLLRPISDNVVSRDEDRLGSTATRGAQVVDGGVGTPGGCIAGLMRPVIAAILAALFMPLTAWGHDEGDHAVRAVLIGAVEPKALQCKLMLSPAAVARLVNRAARLPTTPRWDPRIVKPKALMAFIRDRLVVRINGRRATPGNLSTRFAGLAKGKLPEATSAWLLQVTYDYPLQRPPVRIDVAFDDPSVLAKPEARKSQAEEVRTGADEIDQGRNGYLRALESVMEFPAAEITVLLRIGKASASLILTERKPTFTWRAAAPDKTPPSPLPRDWRLNAGVFRGADGSGCTRFKGVPTEWNEKEKKNFLWRTRLPLGGLASPIAYGDKVLVVGASRKKRELYCLSAKGGDLLWTGVYKSSPKASTKYPVFEDLATFMHAAATPATDGKTVYAIYANGELAAFELASGKNLWSRVIGATDKNTYGLSGSLLIYKDSVIVQFDNDRSLLARYDRAGKEIWKTARDDCTWSSPILIVTANGRCRIITNGDPETCGWDPETGKKLWKVEAVSGEIAPSPIYAGGLVWTSFKGCGIIAIDPAGGKIRHDIVKLENGDITDANSLCTDGAYVYHFVDKLLTCIDVKSGKVVYEKAVPCIASYASPFVNDGKLYLPGNGDWLIGSAGKEFKVVGKGRIAERTDTNPTVVPRRIYIRTRTGLCAIGAR
jgi:outer membrane protein assembly factor BamB